MNQVTRAILAAICGLVSACSHHFPDENARDYYKTAEYSTATPTHNEVTANLKFIKITPLGVVVMQYTTNRDYIVYASPGEYLRGELGNTAFKVTSVDASEGIATIEYLYMTTRPTY